MFDKKIRERLISVRIVSAYGRYFMNKKTFLKHFILSIAALFCSVILSLCVFANEDINVLYEYDFEDYTGGTFAEVNVNNKPGWISQNGYAYRVSERGGAVDILGDTAKATTSANFALDETLTDGCLYISFDIRYDVHNDIVNGSENNGLSYISYYDDKINNDNKYRKYVFYADSKAKKLYGPAANINRWGDTNVFVPYNEGVSYNVFVVCDYRNKVQYTYVDGKLLSAVTFYEINSDFSGICQISFVFNDDISEFDNLKIGYMKDGSFKLTLKEYNTDENTLKFYSNEGFFEKTDFDGAYLKNTLTGNKIQLSEILREGQFEIVVKYKGELEDGEEYQLVLPNNILNILGREPCEPTTFTANLDGGFCLICSRVVDFCNNKYFVSEEIPEPAKTVILKFSHPVSEEGKKLIYISGENLTDYNITWNSSSDSATVEFEEYIIQNRKINISIPDTLQSDGGESIIKGYDFDITVGDGTIKIANFGFFINGVPAREAEILNGTVITLCAEIIKTKPEEFSAVLALAKQKKITLTEFGYENMDMQKEQTYIKKTVDIIVDEKTGFNVKGFLRKGPDMTSPLVENIVLSAN